MELSLFLGLILCMLNSSKFTALSQMGNLWFYGFALVINFIGLIYLLRIQFRKEQLFLFLLALGFLLYSFISLVHDYAGGHALTSLFQIFTIFSFALVILNTKYDFRKMGVITDVILGIFLLLFVLVVLDKFPNPLQGTFSNEAHAYSGFFINSNGFGAFIYLLLYFVFISRRKLSVKVILTVMGLALIVISETRSVLISLMVVLVTYVLWNFLNKRFWTYYGYLTAFLLFIGTFIMFYIKINDVPYLKKINEVVLMITKKNILSGRDRIWPNLFKAIQEKPLFGYGTGTTPGDVMKTDLSAHDLYLQTVLQNGLVGLFLFIVVLFVIWNRYRFSTHKVTRISAAFFMGILAHQVFEVSLTQNNFSYGLMQWFVILLGLNKFVYRRETKTDKDEKICLTN